MYMAIVCDLMIAHWVHHWWLLTTCNEKDCNFLLLNKKGRRAQPELASIHGGDHSRTLPVENWTGGTRGVLDSKNHRCFLKSGLSHRLYLNHTREFNEYFGSWYQCTKQSNQFGCAQWKEWILLRENWFERKTWYLPNHLGVTQRPLSHHPKCKKEDCSYYLICYYSQWLVLLTINAFWGL